MKKILLVSLILLGCSAKTAPQFELLEGGSIDLQSPQKLVLINYWAIWCAPCRKEIPEFNQLLAEQGNNIAVLAVNFDGSQGQQLRDEIAKLGIEFPSVVCCPILKVGFYACLHQSKIRSYYYQFLLLLR